MGLGFTERLLRDAGICRGMKVLDVGCGAGGLTFIASDLVETAGSVVGVDLNKDALDKAKKLARERNASNIEFVHSDLGELSLPTEYFDAVVGRRILMYLPDVSKTLRELSKFVKPGGLFVFQETDVTLGPKGTVRMPLHDKVVNWIWRTLDMEGADAHMGFNLPMKMRESGIDVEHVRGEPVILGQGDHNALDVIVRAMLPRIAKYGIASEAEIGIETLGERLSSERPDGAIYISDMAFGVWGYRREGTE